MKGTVYKIQTEFLNHVQITTTFKKYNFREQSNYFLLFSFFYELLRFFVAPFFCETIGVKKLSCDTTSDTFGNKSFFLFNS